MGLHVFITDQYTTYISKYIFMFTSGCAVAKSPECDVAQEQSTFMSTVQGFCSTLDQVIS